MYSALVGGLSDPSHAIRDMMHVFFNSVGQLPVESVERLNKLLGQEFFNPLKEREWLFYSSTLILAGVEELKECDRCVCVMLTLPLLA